ncbi:MAG TPA: GAF domain-containing protein [Methylomirabilota bacterium]|jgi:GAF domain-containing protein/CheY-like chemotaxis protein|nr:GAF domain-containing protein [Methylomirabilota bacterium]
MTPPGDRLRQVADLARAISGALELDEILRRVIAAVEALRPPVRCAVRYLDRSTGGQRVAGGAGDVAPTTDATVHAVPILAGDDLLGVLEVTFADGEPPSEDERAILTLLAGQAAVAMRNAALFAKSEARWRAAEALAEIGRLLSRTLDPDAVAQHIADSLLRLLASQASAIHRVEPESGDLVILAAAGAVGPATSESLRFPRGTGLIGLVVRDRQPMTTPNVLHDPRVTLTAESRARIEAAPYRAALAVPLIVKDHVIGVLAVADRAGRVFDEEEIGLVQAFADQAALALENARLFSLETSRRQQIETLAEIERELVAELKSDRLLRLIIDRATRLFEANGGIYLVEGERMLVPKAWTAKGALADVHIPFGQGLVGLCAEARRGLVVDDYTSWPKALPQFVALGLTRSMAYPLMIRERLLGVITMNRTGDAAPPFRAEDLAILERCATQAAIALQNATLYEEAERRRREAEELARVARTLTESLDPSAVGERIVQSVLPLFGAQSSSVRLLERDRSLRVVATAGRSATPFEPGHTFAPGAGVEGRVVAEGGPLCVRDVVREPSFVLPDDLRRRLSVAGLGAVLSAPLRAKGETIGTLSIGDFAGRTFSTAEAELLQAFADQAALALETARLYERLEERTQKLAALSALTRLITSAQGSPQVFHAVARAATTLLGAKTSRVWIDDPAVGGLRVQAGFGIDPKIERLMTDHPVIAYGQGAVGHVFASRAPEYIADIGSDPRWLNRRLATEGGLRGFAGVPLIAGEGVVGVLAIIFGEEREFTPEEKELIGLLADQAAIAISNARLYEGQELRAARLRTLARLNQIVSSSLDLNEVLDGIARAAAELMEATLVSISIADERSQTLERRAFSDAALGADYPGTIRRYGEGGAGWVALHRRPLNVPDVFVDERIVARDWFRRHNLKSSLSVPILFQDSLLGVLVLFGRKPFVLDADNQDLLDSFVAQAAVAIRNARLFAELRRAHEDLERSQAQLVRAERLSALGEMAAGVAHDFNNLLAIILGRADLLLRRLKDSDLTGWVEAIRQAARDGADTVRRIQEFTRTRTTRSFARVDLSEVLREVVELTRPRWKDEAQSRGVHYGVTVVGEAPPVAGRPEELREVFANLLTNALDAMPDGGRCVLRMGTEGDAVAIAVADTGSGMSGEVRQRVFEPFFTTKGQRGTGLGLAVAWGIVTRHGGTIDVESTPGRGSTFTVRLPLGRNFAPADEAAPPAPPGRAARVLIIDDEPAVRTMLAALLAEEGHVVVEAASGAEGLARCEREPFDVVLSDLSMPRMSGWEFAATCHEKFPHLPVGLITGWGDRLDPTQLQRHHVRFVLAKPFETADVLRQIAQVLR